jgi:hypothetical protein
VKCKLRRVNFRSERDPRRVFLVAFRVTVISDDWYRKPMWVIVIRLAAHQSARETIQCTVECHQTNAGITNTLREITELVQIFFWWTAGDWWDSQHVHKQLISPNWEFEAWSIVYYHFWIRLAFIFFNIVLLASGQSGAKTMASELTINTGTLKQ